MEWSLEELEQQEYHQQQQQQRQEPERCFHVFKNLPPELRIKIYLLATQPRFVEVSEVPFEDHEEEDEFRQRFNQWADTVPPGQFFIHPSIGYFAPLWRDAWLNAIRESTSHQRHLEHFGFTDSKALRSPWLPSASCPIPDPELLHDQRRWLWEFCRPHALYSAAPIPPLLHTCHESRQFLISHGYTLAFGTRTSPPRTWFHHKDDVLYLRASYHEREHLKGGDPYNLNAFWPWDLMAVKRLCLTARMFPYLDYGAKTFAQALRVIPGVEELFFDSSDLVGASYERDDIPSESRHAALWGWTSWEEPDAADLCPVNMQDGNYLCRDFLPRESRGEFLQTIKSRGNITIDLHQALEIHLQETAQLLLRERAAHISSDQIKPWNIPTMKWVHIGTAESVKALARERREYWYHRNTHLVLELINGFSWGLLSRQLTLPPGQLQESQAQSHDAHSASGYPRTGSGI